MSNLLPNDSNLSSPFDLNFPCYEFPVRCFVSSKDGRYVSSNKEGSIKLLRKKDDSCQWQLIPTVTSEKDELTTTIMIQNCQTGFFLSILNGFVASKGEGENWHFQKHHGNKYSFRHLDSGLIICSYASSESVETFFPEEKDPAIESNNLWETELLSGELCFLSCRPSIASAIAHDGTSIKSNSVLLGCDEAGTLFTIAKDVNSGGGWDVWRLSDAEGSGTFRILSRITNKRLVYNTKTNAVKSLDLYSSLTKDEGEKWLVQKAPLVKNSPNGVLLQTKSTHSFLFLQRIGKTTTILKTIDTFCGAPCIWQLDSANQKKFFIYSFGIKKRIGASVEKGAVTTTTKKKSDVWKIEKNTDNSFSIFSTHYGRYLGVKRYLETDKLGDLILSVTLQKDEKWDFIELPNGTFRIALFSQENEQKLYLNCNEDGKLEIIHLKDNRTENPSMNIKHGTSWYFDPVIPYSVKKRDLANNTAKGAAVMGAVSVGVIGDALNQVDQLIYAADASQMIYSGVVMPGSKPSSETTKSVTNKSDSFRPGSIYNVMQEVDRTNDFTLGSVHPVLSKLSLLCVISSEYGSDKLDLVCDILGTVYTKIHSKGWGVWSFETADDSFFVRIRSWAHEKYLCYNSKTREVCTIKECALASKNRHIFDLWSIDIDDSCPNGVKIRTSHDDKYLQLVDGKVKILDSKENSSFLWEMRAAHYHNYIIRSVPTETWIVTNYRKPSLTRVKKGGSIWRMISYPQGVIVIFSESYEVYLGSDTNGNVVSSKSAQTNEEWYITQHDDTTLRLVSKEHGRYLCCSPSLCTVADTDGLVLSDACKWFLDPKLPSKQSTQEIVKGTAIGASVLGFALIDPISTIAGLSLVGMGMEAIQGAKTTVDYTMDKTTGKLAAEDSNVSQNFSAEDPGMAYIQRKAHTLSCNSTGLSVISDLFFLFSSSPVSNRFVGFNGKSIFVTKEPKGLSVWNFQHIADGKFRIQSWAQEKFLCISTAFGGTAKIGMTTEADESTIWKVEASPANYIGVTIKSDSNSTRYLKFDGANIGLTYSFDGISCDWNLEAANRQNFFLYSSPFKIRIGTQNNTTFTTKGVDKQLVWRVEQDDDLHTSFFCAAADKYLGSDEFGQVTVSSTLGDNEKWKIYVEKDASTKIESSFYSNRYLSCNQVGEAYTNEGVSENSVWKLEPALPQKNEKNETIMKYAAGATMAGLSIVNPVMAFGAFSAVGMTTRAVDDGDMTAMFCGGESASDVDKLADTVVKTVKFNLNSMNESLPNRPFCAWRSW